RYQHEKDVEWLERTAIQKLQGFICLNFDNWQAFKDMKIE
ncbi:unnamed protein product, partial [marine sediment metagenome]